MSKIPVRIKNTPLLPSTDAKQVTPAVNDAKPGVSTRSASTPAVSNGLGSQAKFTCTRMATRSAIQTPASGQSQGAKCKERRCQSDGAPVKSSSSKQAAAASKTRKAGLPKGSSPAFAIKNAKESKLIRSGITTPKKSALKTPANAGTLATRRHAKRCTFSDKAEVIQLSASSVSTQVTPVKTTKPTKSTRKAPSFVIKSTQGTKLRRTGSLKAPKSYPKTPVIGKTPVPRCLDKSCQFSHRDPLTPDRSADVLACTRGNCNGFFNAQMLKLHTQYVHDLNFTCAICKGTKYHNRQALGKHLRLKHFKIWSKMEFFSKTYKHERLLYTLVAADAPWVFQENEEMLNKPTQREVDNPCVQEQTEDDKDSQEIEELISVDAQAEEIKAAENLKAEYEAAEKLKAEHEAAEKLKAEYEVAEMLKAVDEAAEKLRAEYKAALKGQRSRDIALVSIFLCLIVLSLYLFF